MTRPWLRALALAPIAALALTSCSDGTASDPSGAGADDGISIVTSTNVYGDIAQAVAGNLASVTSIIDNASQDPHEYEASAQDRLLLDKADVVIENGGGYDPFVDTMLEASDQDPMVLTAVDLSGRLDGESEKGHDEEAHDEEAHDEEAHDEEAHDHIEGFNEHVWYDFHTMERLAEELSSELGELDPDNEAAYRSNYEDLVEQMATLEESAEALRATAAGRQVALTEPVPVYLLEEVGLTNGTPEEFSEAVEEGADVPPRALQQTLELVTGGSVVMLAYNAQTADSTTEQVRAAAEGAGVPVVDFTETLPEGEGYIQWQQANLDAIAAALG